MVKEKKDHKINADDATERKDFYDMIANFAASANLNSTTQTRPYRAESYILISAGYDGVFGTSDDVVNFGE